MDLAGYSFPLTCVKAERILERKGMMPQTTHRNQKMMRTPEDRTPCSRSYWISRVASSCAGRTAGAGPEHTSGPDSILPHAPWLDVSGLPTSKVSSLLLGAHGCPISIPQPTRDPPPRSPGPTLTMVTPTTKGVTKKTGAGGQPWTRPWKE